MPTVVHIIRHAEAKQNVDVSLRDTIDPGLTARGEEQARNLAESFPYHPGMKIFSSPMRRALQTALLAFKGRLTGTAKIVALPLAQETTNVPCDTGRDRVDLEVEFQDDPVDFDLVVPGWNSKTGKWSQEKEVVEHRAAELRHFLGELGGEHVLVTHGHFLHHITEDWSDIHKHGHWSGYENCETRSYSMINGDKGFAMEETESSRQRRMYRAEL